MWLKRGSVEVWLKVFWDGGMWRVCAWIGSLIGWTLCSGCLCYWVFKPFSWDKAVKRIYWGKGRLKGKFCRESCRRLLSYISQFRGHYGHLTHSCATAALSCSGNHTQISLDSLNIGNVSRCLFYSCLVHSCDTSFFRVQCALTLPTSLTSQSLPDKELSVNKVFVLGGRRFECKYRWKSAKGYSQLNWVYWFIRIVL